MRIKIEKMLDGSDDILKFNLGCHRAAGKYTIEIKTARHEIKRTGIPGYLASAVLTHEIQPGRALSSLLPSRRPICPTRDIGTLYTKHLCTCPQMNAK